VNGVGISQFIANFQLDLADDGVINGSGGATSVRPLIDMASSTVDMSYVAKNLNAFYGTNTVAAKPLNNWIDISGGVDQVIGRYKYFASSPTTNSVVRSNAYIAGSEDVGQCFSFGSQVSTGATGSLYYNDSPSPSQSAIKVAKAGDSMVMGITATNAGKYGGYLLRYSPVNGACPAPSAISAEGLIRVAKFSIVFYGQTIDQTYTAANVAGTSFVSATFPLCGASTDYPVKVFFDSFDANSNGKVFIYGGTSCKSGVEAWYQDLNPGVILLHNGVNTIVLAKKDASTLAFDAYYADTNGARQPVVGGYGTMQVQAAYSTSLYQNAYWTGPVCRLPLKNTSNIGMPTIPYVRTVGFPGFDSVSSSGCPAGWISIQVARHRSLDLNSEQDTANGAYKDYHFQLNTGNWDFQFISSNANASKDNLTSTYPSACSNASAASLSYFSHLTMSKDGFTAAGNVCEGGVPYYQFVKGTFVNPPTYSIGGSLTGLAGGQVTLFNGKDNITLSSNGTFKFLIPAAADTSYAATVSTQPTGQVCTVKNGNGNVYSDINSIEVNCTGNPSRFAYAIGATSGQVQQYSISSGGSLSPLSTPYISVPTPVEFMAIARSGKYAYIASGNSILQYAIAANGNLTTLSQPSIDIGMFSAQIAISPDGKFAYSANQFDSFISQFLINADGTLSKQRTSKVAASAPYAIAIHPSGKYLYASDLNGHNVLQFNINIDGTLVPMNNSSISAGGGVGVMSIAVHPSGKFAYATQDSTNKVSMFNIDADGGLTPMTPNAANTGAEPVSVTISPDGKYAFVTNIGSNHSGNTISQFLIGSTGILTPLSTATVTSGIGPNFMAIDASSRFAYSANTTSSNISQYSIGTTGFLTPLQGLNISAPSYTYSLVIAP